LAKGNAVQYLVDTLRRRAPQHHRRHARPADPGPGADPAARHRGASAKWWSWAAPHFNGGNITPAAEFNLYADPHAAEVVASGVKLTYLPLDVTHKLLTSEARLKQLAA
jgi:purine nucleosidase